MVESRDLHPNEGYARVPFELPHDAESKLRWERVWAKPLDDRLYQIDNIPWYTTAVSLGDVVSADSHSDRLVFHAVVRPSGHSTLQVIVLDPSDSESVRAHLTHLGCATEVTDDPRYFSVDVPPEADLSSVKAFVESQPSKWMIHQHRRR